MEQELPLLPSVGRKRASPLAPCGYTGNPASLGKSSGACTDFFTRVPRFSSDEFFNREGINREANTKSKPG